MERLVKWAGSMLAICALCVVGLSATQLKAESRPLMQNGCMHLTGCAGQPDPDLWCAENDGFCPTCVTNRCGFINKK
jgi:hypothetical protein